MTTTTPYTKFGFDTEFFELVQGQGNETPATDGVAPTKPAGAMPTTIAQFRAQMEETRQQAYAEGYAVGMSEGQNQAQADLAQLQQHLQNALLALQSAQNEREEHLLMQTLSLLRVTLHHLVGQTMANYGPELLEHHLRALLPLLKTDEALTLRIHPAARGFHEKLGLPQASIMGLPMHIAADANLGPTDAVILWANGGVESKLAQHLELVDELLAGAGAQMLNVEHKADLSAVPAMPAMPRTAPPAEAAVASPSPVMPDMDEAEKAARARANALLGDEDELVDALK
jgi:flagellar biosynthesis/type III secretory pathway protein FliH